MTLKLEKLEPAKASTKKWCAIFSNGTRTCFGAKGYEDYTTHKDISRKRKYISRHRNDLRTKDPTKPGYLSMFLLWGDKPEIDINAYNRRIKENNWKLPSDHLSAGINIPSNYAPDTLSKADWKLQTKAIQRSRKNYKKGIYTERKKVKSFKSRPSGHKKNVEKLYGIEDGNLSIGRLAKMSKCSEEGLREIISKGKGAFYSSGSRPNQTSFSWSRARLYSALSGGPASIVDRSILEKYCEHESKALSELKKKLREKRISKAAIHGGTSSIKGCHEATKFDRHCVRKRDGKVFDLPRRFTKKKCAEGIKGFSMRASCAPYY